MFLVLVFGYMDFLIIYKWLKDWGFGNAHAPSIITTMINLPLALGKTVIQFIYFRTSNVAMEDNPCGVLLRRLPRTVFKF